MKLFFDTETSDKLLFAQPPTHPDQPRVIQIAAILTTETGEEVASLHTYLKPDNFVIAPSAELVHGITLSILEEQGIDRLSGLSCLDAMAKQATEIVGHNIKFDISMMKIEENRLNTHFHLCTLPNYCTMLTSTKICKIPNIGKGGYKWPKLTEAYQILLGKDLNDAHDAMADIRATKEIYFKLK